MLSVPHMIVVFLVVLVVFGPQKLPELARTLGKLMAEFRKASTDFKGAFEEEMRDLERQARIAEVRKKTAEAEAAEAKAKDLESPAASSATSGTETLPEAAADYPAGDGPVVKPEAEAIPRLDASNGESVAPTTESKSESSATEPPPAHDQQQPA
ncbi:MAG TPA: twin-arginine translocase TatA/TatE family subunit [Candidatus Acidoferrum sp.]|jgi:sec-independent protein translocase protein TatB|nr:twin-arginine translocase TatA/TatE family subunit [Candidatus Acidoferrum sp.]